MASATTSEPVGELTTYSIRAVQRVCDLLDLLQREPEGVSLVRAAEVTRLPKSSAFRYLATLEARRYVERDETSGEYRIGLAFLPLQARQLDVVTQRARPYLEELQREFGETANLGLLDGNRVVYLDIVESEHTMRLAARPGDHDMLHATALGKAIAAQLPPERVRAILRAEGMPRCTEHTITKQRDFVAELERIRARGYAVDEGENEIGGRCVGATIPGVTLPLAISVSGPAARFAKAQVPAVAARLQDAAARLGADLAPTSA
jgi:IclR family acetate operon transcriptional repressor